ncbi:CLUMA_CG004918, isoform A [Clunio marinus]|uniref:CLUMA_CG004918, isoform A n=1 Tax=Clunio marinus TaxID=568069 RepID=A0A1J1HV61_9DIPT|nr:CLUMA_CG004918, isoform A [Clunio marinus]
MFNRFKNRVLTSIVPEFPSISPAPSHINRSLPDKFQYSRPPFLQLLTVDELKASADHNVRPIIVPRDISVMPLNAGYAECVNSGKSEWNEDQAAFYQGLLHHPAKDLPDLPYIYFGIFDGHAGYGAALAASHQFHHILHEKLVDVIDLLLPTSENETPAFPWLFHKSVSKDELIVGALESAFHDMDAMLAEDRSKYRNAGGCTSVVTLFILGKMYVANAGDSRAILAQKLSKEVIKKQTDKIYLNGSSDNESPNAYQVIATPFSFDHTPDTERSRILELGKIHPDLMGGEYIAMEYAKKPMTRDLGTRILYKQGNMKGWTYKTLTREDLKMSIVTGEGKRSRLLGTIGVTRGFGDHDLRALGSGILIKPFLSCHPEIVYRDLSLIISLPDDNNIDGEYGVLIMGTDGLWDVIENDNVARITFETLKKYPNEKHRYTMVAQELVAKSRGRANDSGHWRLSDLKAPATVDDISIIVIPVYQYYKEFCQWEKTFIEAKQKREELKNLTMKALEANHINNDDSTPVDNDVEEAKEQEDESTIETKKSISVNDDDKDEEVVGLSSEDNEKLDSPLTT